MKKYIYFIILILAVAVPAMGFAQDRPNAKQIKAKPKISSGNKGSQIKYNKLVKDPSDEYSGVSAVTYDRKKEVKKPNNDIVDVADDAVPKAATIQDNYLFDENPQDKDNDIVDRTNAALERPGMPETEEDDEYYDMDNDVITPNYALGHQDDPGTDSEEDILMAGDSAMVHTMKMDISNMAPVEIVLTDPEHGQYFVFPTPSYSIPTSHFGPRHRRFHYGLDLAMRTGEPIYAAFDGVVRFSKYNNSYGNLVVIRHDNGLETYYAHLSKRHVTPGTRVKAGEEIGRCGNTGHSRGSHLHFEIRYNGNAINPENVLSCETRALISPTITLTRNSFRKVAKPGYSNTSNPNHAKANHYSSDGKYYKVRTGDTLSRIAKRNGTTVSKLCKLNGLREASIIRPGQKLRLR